LHGVRHVGIGSEKCSNRENRLLGLGLNPSNRERIVSLFGERESFVVLVSCSLS
jgi:hypothetical protein